MSGRRLPFSALVPLDTSSAALSGEDGELGREEHEEGEEEASSAVEMVLLESGEEEEGEALLGDGIGARARDRNRVVGVDNDNTERTHRYRGFAGAAAIKFRSQKKRIAHRGTAVWRLTWAQVRTSRCQSCLGCCSVGLVVATTALLLSILGKSPLVFLRLAELQNSEVDLTLTLEHQHYRVNYTQFNGLLDPLGEEFSYHSPRMVHGPNSIFNIRNCRVGSRTGVLSCGFKQTTWVYAIDSAREKRMGLGRTWPVLAIGEGEIVLLSDFAQKLGVAKGDTVAIAIDPRLFIGNVWLDIVHTVPQHYRVVRHEMVTFKVAEVIDGAYGKVPSRYAGGSFVELEPFMRHVSKHLQPSTPSSVKELLASLPVREYVTHVEMNRSPTTRLDVYTQPYQQMQDDMTAFADTVLYGTGFHLFHASLALLSFLQLMSFVLMFLQLVINVILAVLVFISVVLLYALLTTSVETRVFELGVLRMQGATTLDIISLVLVHAMFYSAIAFVPALVLAQFAGAYIAALLGVVSDTDIDPWLTASGILMSLALGGGMPILASILPIRGALQNNVHDALDARGGKTKAIKINIDRASDDAGITSPPMMLLGFSTSLFGFAVYYLMPLGLVQLDLSLLMTIFVTLLVGLLLGLALLALNLQHAGETLLCALLLWWEKASIRSVLLKNLVAHRERNQKTLLLFSVSLAFIIFISVSYNIELNSLLYAVQQEHGCRMSVVASGSDLRTRQPNAIKNFRMMENAVRANPTVEDFSWVSIPLGARLEADTGSMTIGRVKQESLRLRTFSPNLLGVAIRDPNFFTSEPGEMSFDPRNSTFDSINIFQGLYTVRGTAHALLGSSSQNAESLHLTIGGHFLEDITWTEQVSSRKPLDRFRLAVAAFVRSAPALSFSMFPNVRNQDLAVALPVWTALASRFADGVEDTPMQKLILRLQSNASDVAKDSLVRQLQGVAPVGSTVWDFREDSERINQVGAVLQVFFSSASAVAMTVCFFALTAGMYTNIHEQTKEIGILRALGVTRLFVFRVYAYEALIVVLTGSFSGTLIGAILAFTMSAQRALFTQMPLPFIMPWPLLATIGAFALISSLLAVASPVFRLMRKSVVSVIRLQD